LGEPSVELLEPFLAWSELAHRAHWTPEAGPPQGVVALLGPELGDMAVARARSRAAGALTLRHDGVLPLLAVEAIAGRGAWLYAPAGGVALGLVLEDLDAPPLKAAAEVVATLACCLHRAGDVRHPGPSADDVLIDDDGKLLLTGFSSPFPRHPSLREPSGAEDEAAQVWRLGVLLAQLASGSATPPAVDPDQHSAAVRRVLIRMLARPGPILPDGYGDLLAQLLSWKAAGRPALSEVPGLLRAAADELPTTDLVAWAGIAVSAVRERIGRGDPIRVPEPPIDLVRALDTPGMLDRTEEAPQRTPTECDPVTPPDQEITAHSHASIDSAGPRILSEQGAIPISIGPPQAGILNPTAPPKMFRLESPKPPSAAARWTAPLAIAAGALMVVAVVLLWVLLT